MSLKYFSAFTGIAGFEAAWQSLGLHVTAMSEIDRNCRRVLAHHFPNTPIMEDIANVSAADIGRPELFVGGFPCQDTSIAAPHRAGLAGRRSGNFFEFTRLLEDYQRLIDALNPRWVVIENPTGLLKSNGGRDMAAVAAGLEDLGYGWAYRVVDARHLGSPQRRGRVLVVGHRGGDPRPAWQVLGDPGDGATPDRADQVRRPTHGPRAVPDALGDGAVVWRKSARARAALSKGGYETWVSDGVGNTLTGFDGGGPARQTHLIGQHGRVRTLTLTEWERLQGFADDWTAMLPDSARYTALGNAMHVGMATWLGRRLLAVNTTLPQIGVPA